MARSVFLWTTFVFIASFGPVAAQQRVPIKNAAVDDPATIVRALKDVHRKLNLPVLFETGHISICDFFLQDDTYSNESKKSENYRFMVYLSSVAGTELKLEQDLKEEALKLPKVPS
jgi:hypothetical protein